MLKSQRCIAHLDFQIFHSKFRSQLLQPPTVDCGSRPEPPPVETCDSCTPMGKCPCPWGYFPDPHDCNQYVYCQVGYQFQHPFLAPTCEEIFFLMPGRWLSRRIRLLQHYFYRPLQHWENSGLFEKITHHVWVICKVSFQFSFSVTFLTEWLVEKGQFVGWVNSVKGFFQ